MSPETVVNTAENTTPVEEAVTNEVDETTTEPTATQETNEQPEETDESSPKPAVELNADLYDERGVPWKNRAMEYQRKFEDTQSSLPRQIAEEVAKLAPQQQKQKYTVAQLEEFAQENPQHRGWVEQEKAALLKEELSRDFDQRIAATTQAQKNEMIRNNTFNQVLAQFPDIATRDQQGNFLGWNNMNPMTQLVGKYMSSPDLANRPDGLLVAAKLAYADHALSTNQKTTKQVRTLKSQVRKAQAATMLEGGGRKAASENPNKKYMDRVRETGKITDGVEVMRNILRSQGSIKE